MPEGLLEQPENSTPMMDVYSPEGTKGKVPFTQWADYQKQGFKPAVRVTSPSGTGGWLPSNKVGDYTKNHGFKLGPPEQQKLGGEQAITPGTKSGVSMNAPMSSLTTGVTSGLGLPESQHPVADIAKSASGLNASKAELIKAVDAARTGHPVMSSIHGAIATMPPIATLIHALTPNAQLLKEGVESIKDAGISSDVVKTGPMTPPPIAPISRFPAPVKPFKLTGPGGVIENPAALGEGLIKSAAGAVPVIGPAAYESGSEIGEGIQNKDVDQALHGAGKGVGLVGSLLLGTEKGQAATESLVPKIARPVEAAAEATSGLAKRGVHNVKTAINPVDNMTAGELATKAVRPRNSKTNFPTELETALPDTKRALQNAGVDQSNMTLHDVLDAATQAKKDVWAEYQQNHSGPAGELQIDTTPIADAMLSKITPRMRTQQPSLVKQIEANAAEYSGKSMAAQDLEQRVGEANNETRGIEAKYLTDKNAAKLDPSNAALFAERDTARQLLLSKLDEATGPGAAQLRQRYGNLNSFQDVVSRRIPVADRAAPMGLPQILAKMYGPGKIIGGLAQVATGIGAGHGIANIIEGGASMIGAKNARLMNDPDALIQHAFDKTEATPAARPYVAPPTPAIRGLLPPGPAEFGEQRTVPGSNLSLLPSVPPQGREGLLPAASRIDPETGHVQYLTSPAEPGTRAPIARPNQQSAAPIPARTPQEPPQGAPAAAQPIADRRVNPIQRKLVSEMSPEERGQALLTSEKTGLPNRRAFDEAGPAKAVAMSDADGLKALNDKFGYDAGDALLKAKADALKEAGLDAFHEKGDEFLYRGDSPADLQAKLDKARDILRNKTISVEMNDGRILQFKGADFSYGTGENLSTAETGLKANKSQREAAGERARGELRGIAEVGSEAGQENLSGAVNSDVPRIARPNQQNPVDLNAPKSKRVIPPDVTAKADMGGQSVGIPPQKNPNFKNWFGDSQVRDEKGKPLVVFHGSNKRFDEFKPTESFRNSDSIYGGTTKVTSPAFFFTDDKATAQTFAKDRAMVSEHLKKEAPGTPQTHAFYLKAENPLDLTTREGMEDFEHVTGYTPETWEDVQRMLDDKDIVHAIREYGGYDAVRLRESNGANSWAVFDPTQIKSATRNKGTFDPKDPKVINELETPQGYPKIARPVSINGTSV